MFVKLVLHAVRNYAMSLTQIVTPVFFVACACGIIMTLPQADDLPPLYLNVSKYQLVVVPYLTEDGAPFPTERRELAERYRDVILSQVRSPTLSSSAPRRVWDHKSVLLFIQILYRLFKSYFYHVAADKLFTALHVMQTRYCDEISVRPSVRLSVRHTREL